jgi:hypothetical protein
MARRYPDRRRRRPGRRRPDRGPIGQHARGPRPRGFTGPGWRQLFHLVLPFDGRGRWAFFNGVSDAIVIGAGMCGAALGYAWLGLLGALVGFVAAITAVGTYLERNRFVRR